MPKNATVLMVRHAEKPTAGDDPTLAVPGQERAQAYAIYFQHYSLDGSDPLKLSHLFAAADSPESQRPRLTIEPLAQALRLDIDDKHKDKEYQPVVDDLLTNPKYDDAGILVCWHHEHLLPFAQALGVDPSTLPPQSTWPTQGWPDDVYGWVLQLCYGGDGQLIPAQTICLNQKLMYDDYGRDPGGA